VGGQSAHRLVSVRKLKDWITVLNSAIPNRVLQAISLDKVHQELCLFRISDYRLGTLERFLACCFLYFNIKYVYLFFLTTTDSVFMHIYVM
jgi:hypothetical protein